MGYSVHIKLLPGIEQEQVYDAFNFGATDFDCNDTVLKTAVSIFTCPSLPSLYPPGTSFLQTPGTSYLGVFGVGDGREDTVGTFGLRHAKQADIADGLSQTSLMGEVVPSVRGTKPERWRFQVRETSADAAGFEDACSSLPLDDWVIPNVATTWVLVEDATHLFTPNLRFCTGKPFFSAKTVGSLHSGGANVSMCDGSVHWVSDSIDREVWHAMGTAARGEIVASR